MADIPVCGLLSDRFFTFISILLICTFSLQFEFLHDLNSFVSRNLTKTNKKDVYTFVIKPIALYQIKKNMLCSVVMADIFEYSINPFHVNVLSTME